MNSMKETVHQFLVFALALGLAATALISYRSASMLLRKTERPMTPTELHTLTAIAFASIFTLILFALTKP